MITKKKRILIVLSALWFIAVFVFAVDQGQRYGLSSFDFSKFIETLFLWAVIPLVSIYGIIWIRVSPK